MNLLTKTVVTKISILLFSVLLNPVHGQTQRPNIIYIMTDDMGYADLSGYGTKDYQTPNLDKLASQGIKFTDAYSAGSLCTPTRTAFVTGRYPAKTPIGLLEPHRGMKAQMEIGLTAEYTSIATLMKRNGYETALIGKWHLGFLPKHSPTKNGFDYFFGFHAGAADYISHTSNRGPTRVHDLYENDSLVYTNGYLTDLFSAKAIDFLKKKHDKPFFLEIAFNAPHWPWQGPTDSAYPDSVNFTSGGSPAVYAAMMKSLDEAVGVIMATIDAENLTNETIIIFTNDNGGEKHYSNNGGFSQEKGSLWEGGIRVPAFVRWPNKIKAGTTSPQVVTTMDWTATILAAGGAQPDKNFPLDGIDLMPILTGKKPVLDRELYWRTFQIHENTKHKAMRMGNWKYLQDEKGEYLFNLSLDPQEKNDLKAKEDKKFKTMKLKFTNWEKTVLPPVPL
jgi:arylsulfatase A-like enzyme